MRSKSLEESESLREKTNGVLMGTEKLGHVIGGEVAKAMQNSLLELKLGLKITI